MKALLKKKLLVISKRIALDFYGFAAFTMYLGHSLI
jgi:hypothetical protein